MDVDVGAGQSPFFLRPAAHSTCEIVAFGAAWIHMWLATSSQSSTAHAPPRLLEHPSQILKPAALGLALSQNVQFGCPLAQVDSTPPRRDRPKAPKTPPAQKPQKPALHVDLPSCPSGRKSHSTNCRFRRPLQGTSRDLANELERIRRSHPRRSPIPPSQLQSLQSLPIPRHV